MTGEEFKQKRIALGYDGPDARMCLAIDMGKCIGTIKRWETLPAGTHIPRSAEKALANLRPASDRPRRDGRRDRHRPCTAGKG